MYTHDDTCLITLAIAGAIGFVPTSATAAAVQGAVKLVDRDGVLAVHVVITFNAGKPGACTAQMALAAATFESVATDVLCEVTPELSLQTCKDGCQMNVGYGTETNGVVLCLTPVWNVQGATQTFSTQSGQNRVHAEERVCRMAHIPKAKGANENGRRSGISA